MQQNNRDWLGKIAEYVSLTGSVVGSVAALLLGKLNYGGVILFLSLWLNLVNRHRLHLLNQQRLVSAITEIDRSLSDIQTATVQQVGELKTELLDLNRNLEQNPSPEQIQKLLLPFEKRERQLTALDESVGRIGTQIDTLLGQLLAYREEDSALREASAQNDSEQSWSQIYKEQLESLPDAIADLSEQIVSLSQVIGDLKQRFDGESASATSEPTPPAPPPVSSINLAIQTQPPILSPEATPRSPQELEVNRAENSDFWNGPQTYIEPTGEYPSASDPYVSDVPQTQETVLPAWDNTYVVFYPDSATTPYPVEETYGSPYPVEETHPSIAQPEERLERQGALAFSSITIDPTHVTETYGEEFTPKIDLRGANLVGGSLTQANLAGGDLCEANLSEADLSRSDLRQANLMGANLSGANLDGADLDGANLAGADLTRVNLRTTLFRNVYLGGANLAGVNLSGFNLSSCNLSGANLADANLSSTDLSLCELGGANLIGADLSGANLEQANLNHANLTNANLTGANLGSGEKRARLHGAIMPDGSEED